MDQRPIHEHLSRLGVKPRLNKRHDGVEISPEDDRTLPDDVRQSILEHEDELVRDLLIARAFKHVDGYLIKRMGETRETHAYNLTFSYFASHEPRVELINHSYDNDDIEGFKSTLER